MAKFRLGVRPRSVFSDAGRAGPRRLVVIGATACGVVALGVGLTLGGGSGPLASRDARMQPMDPLPGGLNTTPEQDALARVANTEAAMAAQARGESYTPPIDASVRLARRAEPGDQPASAPPFQPLPPRSVTKPARVYPTAPVIPVSFPAASPPQAAKPNVVPVQASGGRGNDDAERQAYERQVREMLDGWTGRAPHTDVVLPPPEAQDEGAPRRAPPPAAPGPRRYAVDANAGVQTLTGNAGELLVPAGRGIYAHPVLALSSDSNSPVIFQADSGRLKGDRMIGSFSREANRLVVRITSVIHRGEPIGVDGFAVAPETMEAGVATGVDQHYLSRFALPAAAAFVQGLGSAIASSNSTSVIGAYGGVTTTQRLNLAQEAGVGAGVAASNIGSTLNAAAPKGPTVTLDANVPVGVMFLTNVVSRPQQ